MVDRANKPPALRNAAQPVLPQAQVSLSHGGSRVSAVLPTGESVEVLLHGATVLSWRDAKGQEKLWLSDAAALDGSKAVRGGIPVVFPVFGTAPSHPQLAKLPQHGFARTSRWEFLGKSTSESAPSEDGASSSKSKKTVGDGSVKLDFGLSSATLDPAVRQLWPFDFALIYSVNLSPGSLSTSLVVTNDGSEPFEFQALMHTYLRVNDINNVTVVGLESAPYVDKVDGGKSKTQAASSSVSISSETDRVYSPAQGAAQPVSVVEAGRTLFTVTRENLDDVVVWNPWADKARGMADFAPDAGFKNMLCVEPGSVSGFTKLEPGDAFEGSQSISYET